MRKFIKEFKEFAMKGNVMDMAVGVVIGGAFSSIVTSLVQCIITPLIGVLTGGVDLSDKAVVLSTAEDGTQNLFKYGAFLQSVIDFLIIALSIFIVIKIIAKVNATLNAKRIAEEEARKAAEAAAPKAPTAEQLLADILAELRKDKEQP